MLVVQESRTLTDFSPMKLIILYSLLSFVLSFQFETSFDYSSKITFSEGFITNAASPSPTITSSTVRLSVLDQGGIESRLAIEIVEGAAATTEKSCYYILWGLKNATSLGNLSDGIHFGIAPAAAAPPPIPPLSHMNIMDIRGGTVQGMNSIVIDVAADPSSWLLTAADSSQVVGNTYRIDLVKKYTDVDSQDIPIPKPTDPPINMAICRIVRLTATQLCPGYRTIVPTTGFWEPFAIDSYCTFFGNFRAKYTSSSIQWNTIDFHSNILQNTIAIPLLLFSLAYLS